MKTKKVRIIGGTHKRRFIEFSLVNGLRPTPDRLRETIFNWLLPYLDGASVLDMCAGSGVLGLESLSRGARHAVLIEPNKKQFHTLTKSTQDLLLSEKTTLVNQKAEVAINKLTIAPFDIIFIDPPYSANLWNELIKQTINNNLCHAETMIYIEADKPHDQLGIDATIWQTLNQVKQTKQGQIFAGVYQIAIN